MNIYWLLTLLSICTATAAPHSAPTNFFSITHQENTPTQSSITLVYQLPENLGILFDHLHFSLLDAPACQIQTWKSSEKTTTCIIKSTEERVSCFTNQGTIILQIVHPTVEDLAKGSIYITFYTQENPKTAHYETIPLYTSLPKTQENNAEGISIQSMLQTIKEYVSHIVEQAESPLLQMILILILGLLMSLTPCIYPMIPITIGIIQSNKSSSLRRSFILACAYALGIALTFATMGFVVAMGGAQFGSLLGKPWFIIAIVLFLGYFAGSMLGFYEVRLPQFNAPATSQSSQGSIKSAFLFGAISGTITSPCLSPGLVLVLGMVAKLTTTTGSWISTLQNSLIGFSYLFMFGIGLSIPLVILATFSGSAEKLPRSGLWMVEVKKIFGFLLIGLCFSYLNPLLSATFIYILAGATLLLVGIALQKKKMYGASPLLARYILITNSIIIGLGVFFFGYGLYTPYSKSTHEVTLPAIAEALKQAKNKGKPYVLVEFGASWCSSCVKIKKELFNNTAYHAALPQVVFAHCDCTKANDLTVQAYQKEYGVSQGLPMVLLLEAKTNKVLQRWRSEILHISPQELATIIGSHSNS